MVGRFYEPDDKICLIFDNVNYDKLRELSEFSSSHADEHDMSTLRNKPFYHDMPHARQWADEFEEGIKAYGISEEQIQRYKDVDWDTMERAINQAREQIVHN